ncbi:hypothetical protein CVT24_013209 [Panaeolus cyanescens]|uniref:Uncharacterized protein n=1 Tax=Panaeolus cyanescens TaxID=181874 RepID=A0A409YMY0_9AGAR|nr:hypothetical protein CVT24_013209 [Panaeolus cyanescens]
MEERNVLLSSDRNLIPELFKFINRTGRWRISLGRFKETMRENNGEKEDRRPLFAPRFFNFKTELDAHLDPNESYISDVEDCDYDTSIADVGHESEMDPFEIDAEIPAHFEETTTSNSSDPSREPLTRTQKRNLRNRKKRNIKRTESDIQVDGTNIRGSSSQHVLDATNNVLPTNGLQDFSQSLSSAATVPGWIGRNLEYREKRVYGLDELQDRWDMTVVEWDGKKTVPIVDEMGRICVLLGGIPGSKLSSKTTIGDLKDRSNEDHLEQCLKSDRGTSDWMLNVHDQAFDAIKELRDSGQLNLPGKYFEHRRGTFPCIPVGISHGGGQPYPRRLTYEKKTSELLDNLIRKPCFQRISGFTNSLFRTYIPRLYNYYETTLDKLVKWSLTTPHPIVKNYEQSAFACTSVNMGPHTCALPHLDHGNLSFGLCTLTALGDFNPDEGGHLTLWKLRMAIRFPPGSTIFLPSAVMEHSNTPVQKDEDRCSFAQYTSGGIFRWVDHGFKSDEEYFKPLSKDPVKMQQERDAQASRWQRGFEMHSTIDELCARNLAH